MSKMRALLVGAMASGALAAGAFIPAHADPLVPTPIGELHVHGTGPNDGSIKADGASSNPDPLDGSVTISSAGVCTSDDAPTNPTNTCNQNIILNELP